MIVQEAAYTVGYRGWFTDYALLGDDIVISNKAVADSYLALMGDLGVEINMSKSVVSRNGFSEFAKRWVHPHLGEFSPIGIKLLLGIVKNITMYPVLLVEMAQKAFPLYPSSVKAVLSSLYKIRSVKPNKPKDKNLYKMLVFATMAPTGLLKHGHMITEWLNVWISDALGMSKTRFLEAAMYSPYLRNQVEDSQRIPKENWEFFKKNFLKVPLLPKNKLLSWVLKPMVVISPGPWLYAIKIRRALDAPFSASFNLYGLFNPDMVTTPGALSLSALGDFVDLYSIDFSKRGVASRHTLALSKFYEAIHLADKELSSLPSQYPLALMQRNTSLVLYSPSTVAESPLERGLVTPDNGIQPIPGSSERAAPLLEWPSSEGRELRRAVG
jgi:hypothetical protein